MTVPFVSSKSTSDTSSTGASNSASDSYTNPASELNQTDFLKLLVAQIQYQDPMNPQSDTDMAAQLAQFTSLQQATQSSNSLAMMQANSLVGSTVTVQVDSTHSATGVVSGVVMYNNAPKITIGTANYGLNQVTAVAPTPIDSSNSSDSSANSSDPTTN